MAGCGKCPRCDEEMVLFSNNVLFGWTCLDCGEGGIGEQPPSACPKCRKGRVEDRVARIPDILHLHQLSDAPRAKARPVHDANG
jgi:hypothetical protein